MKLNKHFAKAALCAGAVTFSLMSGVPETFETITRLLEVGVSGLAGAFAFAGFQQNKHEARLSAELQDRYEVAMAEAIERQVEEVKAGM